MVRAPGGEPVAKMRADYTSEDDTGVFSQLVTMGLLQGLGIATMLIGAGERRVRACGLAFAALGVEDNTPGHVTSTSGSDTRRPAASTHHGNRGRHRRPRGVRNHAHDSAQAPLKPGR